VKGVAASFPVSAAATARLRNVKDPSGEKHPGLFGYDGEAAMSLAQLRLLAADLETDESGNELVSYIYNDAHQDTGARAFVDKYADPIVRARVFEGTTVNGGRVSLGTPAACLKNALQRRYVAGVKNNQPNIFKPVLAYHITSSEQTMRSILSTGFRVGDGAVGASRWCSRSPSIRTS